MRLRGQKYHDLSGFTLLEVMVAMAILALLVSSVMSIFSSSLAGISKSDLFSEGVLVARNVLEAHLLKTDLAEGEYSGSAGDLFRWTVLVTTRSVMTPESDLPADGDPLPIDWIQDDSPLMIYELEVIVSWPEASYPGSVSLITLQTRIDAKSDTEEIAK